MLTKSKVTLTRCASCEKGINNLLTGPSEHQNWNRLPFREPNEMIARVSLPSPPLAWLTPARMQFMSSVRSGLLKDPADGQGQR